MVLPRGLTWANPLGRTVATRQTLAGKAVLMCSWRALGIRLTLSSATSFYRSTAYRPTAIPHGALPTGIVATTFWLAVSITETLSDTPLAT